MTGYHTRWVQPAAEADDPERIAIREALAFGKAVYDRRTALSMTAAELAGRAGMTVVRLTPGHDLGSVGFATHAAWARDAYGSVRPGRS
jgi:hypothetical protein